MLFFIILFVFFSIIMLFWWILIIYREYWSYTESRKAMNDYYNYILYCHKNKMLDNRIRSHLIDYLEYSRVYGRAKEGYSWNIKDYIKDKDFFEEIQEWRKKK